jgi:hypothetical protein
MAKFNDLTGKTIGRLTFIQEEVKGGKRFWKVKCQCGNETIYRADYISRLKSEGKKFECGKCRMERRSPTLTDKVFGRLTVIKEVTGKDHHRWWLCQCECGEKKEIPTIRLLGRSNGHKTKSCGCLGRKLNSKWVNTTQYPPKHELKTKETEDLKYHLYHCRNAMVASCYRKKDPRYKLHGAISHKVCDLWRNGAKDFVYWCITNGYKKGDAIFLKEGKKIFSPENCFIQSKSEFFKVNNSKLIKWKGKEQSITDWANELGCTISCLSSRLKRYSQYGIDKIMDLSWVAEKNRSYGTEHFENDIIKLYQEGKTFIEIGLKLGCSSSTIGRFLKKNKITARPAKCRSSLN